jgi:hypothetical protein
MRKSFLTLFILAVTTFLYGQEIKISIAPTISFAPNYRSVLGGPGQNIKSGFSTSFDYLFLSPTKINIGFGLDYQYSQVEFVPNLNTQGMIQHYEKVSLISIRFKSVLNFKKQFYLSLDPALDLHLNHKSDQILDNQTGLGVSVGLGKNIKINDALSLNIEPKLWIHNIIPFDNETYPYRLTTIGLNFGLIFGQNKNDNTETK